MPSLGSNALKPGQVTSFLCNYQFDICIFFDRSHWNSVDVDHWIIFGQNYHCLKSKLFDNFLSNQESFKEVIGRLANQWTCDAPVKVHQCIGRCHLLVVNQPTLPPYFHLRMAKDDSS